MLIYMYAHMRSINNIRDILLYTRMTNINNIIRDMLISVSENVYYSTESAGCRNGSSSAGVASLSGKRLCLSLKTVHVMINDTLTIFGWRRGIVVV